MNENRRFLRNQDIPNKMSLRSSSKEKKKKNKYNLENEPKIKKHLIKRNKTKEIHKIYPLRNRIIKKIRKGILKKYSLRKKSK